MADPSLYVGFSSSRGFLPGLIRLFSGTYASGGVNHMFLAWEDKHLGWVTLGANSNGVTLVPWAKFTEKRKVVALFKPANPACSLWTGLKKLEIDINAGYSYLAITGIGLMGIAGVLFREKARSNPLDLDKAELFCSEFASQVIRKAGFNFLPQFAADMIKPQDALHELARRQDFVQGALPCQPVL